VAFSPDGKTIVSGSSDGTVRLWDLGGNPIGQPFEGHKGSVNSVAFSPDGKTIVSGGSDGRVRLWDLRGNPIGEPFEGHIDDVNSVAFSPDGETLVSGSSDETVRLWKNMGWRGWLRTCCRRLHNDWSHDLDGTARRACLIEQGHTLAEMGEIEAAVDHFRQALEIPLDSKSISDPDTEAKRRVATILQQQAVRLARQGKYEEAIAQFQQAAQLDLRLNLENLEQQAGKLAAPIFKMQATIQALKGNIEGAIAKFEQATTLDPTLNLQPELEARRIAASVSTPSEEIYHDE
jgi:tetratricopeptide (TPR) repeat protein